MSDDILDDLLHNLEYECATVGRDRQTQQRINDLHDKIVAHRDTAVQEAVKKERSEWTWMIAHWQRIEQSGNKQKWFFHATTSREEPFRYRTYDSLVALIGAEMAREDHPSLRSPQ